MNQMNDIKINTLTKKIKSLQKNKIKSKMEPGYQQTILSYLIVYWCEKIIINTNLTASTISSMCSHKGVWPALNDWRLTGGKWADISSLYKNI
jgi:hypothetical protein